MHIYYTVSCSKTRAKYVFHHFIWKRFLAVFNIGQYFLKSCNKITEKGPSFSEGGTHCRVARRVGPLYAHINHNYFETFTMENPIRKISYMSFSNQKCI